MPLSLSSCLCRTRTLVIGFTRRHVVYRRTPWLEPVETPLSTSYTEGVANSSCDICSSCLGALQKDRLPKLALSNQIWIGNVPSVLRILSLPERLLVSRHLPAAYIVKLFPNAKGSRYWINRNSVNSGLRGNVSTYQMDIQGIAGLIETILRCLRMPPPVHLLSATIGITFIGPKKLPELTLPDYFIVRRKRVHDALIWLQENDTLYANISIDTKRL